MQMQQIHVCKYSSAPFRCVLTLLSSSAEKHSSVSSTAPPSSGSNVMPGWSVTFAHSVTPKSNMFVIVVGSYLGHMTSENSGGISTHVSMTTPIAQVQVTIAPCYPLVKVSLLCQNMYPVDRNADNFLSKWVTTNVQFDKLLWKI